MMHMTEIPLRDATLAAACVGEGSTVLLLHGALGDCRTLVPVARELAPRRRAICPTQRHSGPIGRRVGGKPFGTAAQSEDILESLDGLGLAHADVVAWSFAAHSALAAAIRAPGRIRSLFLYDLGFPTFVTDPLIRGEIDTANGIAFGPVAEAASRGDWEEAARRLIDSASGRCGWFDEEPPDVRRIHLDNADTIGLLFAQTPPVPIAPEDLARLTVPTTIAWGAASPAGYRLVSQTAGRLVPEVRAVEIPSAGHLLPEAEPARFARLVAEHLDAWGS